MIIDFTSLSTIPRTGTIGYLRGSFDLLHRGHIHFIEFAKKHVDTLVVGVISDETIKRRKGPSRPINTAQDRLTVINSIKGVDYSFVIPSKRNSTEIVLSILQPSVLIQYSEDQGAVSAFRNIAEKYNVQYIVDTSEKVQSTTKIVNKIKKG